MLQPHSPQQSIVPLLVENELPVTAEPGVHLAVLVEVRRVVPAAVLVVEVEDHALTDVDEEARVDAASIF